MTKQENLRKVTNVDEQRVADEKKGQTNINKAEPNYNNTLEEKPTRN